MRPYAAARRVLIPINRTSGSICQIAGMPTQAVPMMEVRLHGRGGQGGVTCAKIIAALYARMGKAVQTFGDYAGERSGAPVRAYTRVSDAEIFNRNKVYRPGHLLVLDPTLLGPEVLSGLVPGGTVLLNSPKPPEAFDGPFAIFRVGTVDATAIARRHKIGSRSVVIVNTTIAGAFARLFDLPFSLVEAAFEHLGYQSNLPAAREAYEAVRWRAAAPASPRVPAGLPALGKVVPLEEAVEGAPTGLHTGSWRTQAPRYLTNLAPCSAKCPAGNDVVGFVQALARTGEAAAAELLWRTTPLAGVCGRVCPAPCMGACNRKGLDGAVNVRALERWISDHAPRGKSGRAERGPKARRIAIVGAGPAGLSAARAVALSGNQAVLIDREKRLGGVLRTGIPAYRLPREVLDREVDAVLELGVEPRCGESIDAARLPQLSREYDAVVLATGLQRLRGVEGPGGDLMGVEQGIKFLHRVNVDGNARLGGEVVVLGGGNTAMDCARSAVRAGASKVTVAYRRTRAEMPANADEIQQAEEEGVQLLFLRQPVGFVGKGRLEAVELAEVELGAPDQSGRRSPVVTDRRTQLRCDAVLLAMGQTQDHSLLPEGWEVRLGRVHSGGRPLNVFAAGDLSTAAGTVAHAIGDGRRTAIEALSSLGCEVQRPEVRDPERAVKPSEVRFDHFERIAQAQEAVAPAAARSRELQVEVGLGLQSAAEARRCFSCGDCTSCDTCIVFCPEGIIHRKGDAYEVDLDFCKGCGLCVAECPRKAMEMVSA